jgi:hypothetical protein|tara:strand:- start:601 stop:966 length:366 start_codon:yes stop_codon:yes gene_type:complete
MQSYKVYFQFECSPETHWGIPTDEEVIIVCEELYNDDQASFDSNGEPSSIKKWEDVVDDLDARWFGESLSEYDYMDQTKQNPLDNGKTEFEDGTGDVNLETIKIEIYSDNEWKNIKETITL